MNGTLLANLAHALMLYEQGIIPQEQARLVLTALAEMVDNKGVDIEINPRFGDIYNCIDTALTAKVGSAAGWLHAGRPRREAINVGYLLETRKRSIDFGLALVKVGKALNSLAGKHHLTIMPDFTYLHHAQPTSLAHYLMTFINPLFRDLERWSECYTRLNQSPAGSGSVNGSRLPLDKQRLAELLGFQGVSVHTRDAMWQPDMPLELASNVASAMMNLSRLCEELILWNTAEFGLVTLPDELCRASVIMPQKKNPYPLVYFRGLTSRLTGLPGEFLALGKGPSGFPDSRTFVYDRLPDALEKSAIALTMLAYLIENLEFNKALMHERSSNGFTFATDLADELILRFGCDYRKAHDLVGKMVRKAKELPKTTCEDLYELFQSNSIDSGVDLSGLTLEEFLSIIDPLKIIASRKTLGSAGLDQVEKMIMVDNKKLDKHYTALTEHQEIIAAVPELLKDLARKV